jgi:hypothetical protein
MIERAGAHNVANRRRLTLAPLVLAYNRLGSPLRTKGSHG